MKTHRRTFFTLSLSLSLFLFPFLWNIHTHTLTHTLSISLSHSLSLTHTYTHLHTTKHSFFASWAFWDSHTQQPVRGPVHGYTHTRTRTHTPHIHSLTCPSAQKICLLFSAYSSHFCNSPDNSAVHKLWRIYFSEKLSTLRKTFS